MRLAQISKRMADLSDQYEVPEKLERVSEKVYDGMSVASNAARKGAAMAYRTALENPRTSAVGGIILAAALIGGVLWYVFGERRRPPAARRRPGTRVRAGAERRKRSRPARPAAA